MPCSSLREKAFAANSLLSQARRDESCQATGGKLEEGVGFKPIIMPFSGSNHIPEETEIP